MGSLTDFFERFQGYGPTAAVVVVVLVVVARFIWWFIWNSDRILKLPENTQKAAATIWRMITRAPNDLALLNDHFKGHAEILATSTNIRLQDRGLCQPNELAVLADAQREKEKLRREQKVNKPHAILKGDPDWNANLSSICYVTMDFATVRALRRVNNKPAVLSGNSVVVNPVQRLIYLHKRSEDVDTYPLRIHTLGGALIPNDPGVLRFADEDLRATIYRELLEEIRPEKTEIRVCPDDTPPIMMVRETTTGFIQGVLLGVKAERTDGERHHTTVEGPLVNVPFDALPGALLGTDRRWVPSGKLHVLAWLAAGTPPYRGAKFGKYSADALLREALSQAPRHLPGNVPP